MSLRDEYLRVKGRWKQRLGINSPNTSSSSVGQARPSRSPSPTPRTLSQPHSQTPIDATTITSGHLSPHSVSAHQSTDFPVATPSTPVALFRDQEHQVERSTPRLATQNTVENDDLAETTPERKESVAWSGFRVLLQVLASSSDVFPPLESAVKGLRDFVETFETASRAREDYIKLGTDLDSLLRDMSMYVGNTVGPRMTNSVKNLWIGLNEELKTIRDKLTRGRMQGHVEAQDDSEDIVKFYQRIHGHLERLALNANLSMWQIANESATETRLYRLSPVLSAVYNSADSEKVKRRLCTPGTREKELDKLLGWARNKSPEAEDVYWMNGMAGTGKTTIACSLCAELDNSSELGASFFCSKQLPECRDVKLIIPCIAYQLARFSIPFRHALSNVLEADPDVHTRVLQTQFDNLLVNPLHKVKNTLPSDFVIVIDALDECDSEDSVGLILDILLSHTTGELPVRFLLSSRPESEIYDRMMSRVGDGLAARLVLHNVDAEAVRQDIRTYLEAELATVGPTPFQLTALVDLSGVLFIFASTAARYITDGLKYMIHKRRLDMILGLSQTNPGSKGDGIDKLYASILKAVLENESVEDFLRTRLKMMLDTVICAQEPMTVDVIAGLLGEESGRHVEVLLRRLSSVLNIAESNGLVTTLHASFPDYMLDHRRSASFHCNPQTTHSRLSRMCFDAIKTQDPEFNLCGLESSYLRDDEHPNLKERTSMIVSHHLLYACCYWMAHLELGEEADKMWDPFWDFLSNQLLLWIEVLNLVNRMHFGPNITRRAENWSKIKGYSKETIELAHDAWRFVTMFASHPVSQSTPHLYVSMLAFWPASSSISKHYRTPIRGGVQPRGSAMTRRRLALLATWMFDYRVYTTCCSPNGSLIAVGVSSSVYVIDSITGRAAFDRLVHHGLIWAIAFSPDGTSFATACGDSKIRVWDTTDGKPIGQPLDEHTGYIYTLCFFPDGTQLAAADSDNCIRVWDVKTGELIHSPTEGHTDSIMSVSVSSDGTRIASGSCDKTIRVWDARSGRIILGPLEGHTARIDSVCFSPDDVRLVSGSWDNTVRVWSNLGGPTTVELLQGHTDQVISVAFSPNDQYIVSGSKDNTVRLWDAGGDLDCIAILRGHMNTVTSVAFSFDSARIVSGSYDKSVRVWDTQAHDVHSSLDGHTSSVACVSFASDGRRVLSSSDDNTICIWDAQSAQLSVGPFRGHTNWVNSVCFSPDGTQIASGSVDSTVRWWDAHSGHQIDEPVTGHTNQVWSVCFSPDGALVASSSDDQTIRLWDAQTHELVGHPIEGHTNSVRSVCFSSDGLRLVSGSLDTSIIVWDVDSRQQAFSPLQGHTKGVVSVHISPDGTRIASGSWDETVRLWDAKTGEAILSPLQGHTAEVVGVQFSHSGLYVVSCSTDRSLRIWNAHTAEAVGDPLLGHAEEVRSCSFSPCDKWIVSGSNDGAITIWNVDDLVGAQGPEGKSLTFDLVNLPLNQVEIEVHHHDVQSNDHPFTTSDHWRLQEDGWVVDNQNRLLAWVPPDLRHVLMSPRNPLLICADGSFRLEFDHAKLGDKWADSYAA